MCTTHSQLCESLSLRSMCVDLCRKLLLFPCICRKSGCFHSALHHLPALINLQNVNFALCLPGAMTQPFVAHADNVLCIDVLLPSAVPSCVLCDPANPTSMQLITSDNSDNYMATNITNTLERAEAPFLKLNQVVKNAGSCHVRAQQAIVGCT